MTTQEGLGPSVGALKTVSKIMSPRDFQRLEKQGNGVSTRASRNTLALAQGNPERLQMCRITSQSSCVA